MPGRPTLAPLLAAALGTLGPGPEAPGAALATTGPWVDHGQARVRLVSALAEAAPGGDAALGLHFVLAPGWHVYWKNAGDAGYAPRLQVVRGLAPGTALLYPAPHRFELPGELVAFGYEGEVVYPVEARLDPALASGAAAIETRLDYLVCAESCIPHVARLTLDLPVGAGRRDDETAALLARWRGRVPLGPGAPGAPGVRARLERGAGAGLELVLALDDAGRAAAPDLFFEADPALALGRPVFRATAEGPAFRVPVAPVDPTRPWPERLRFAWTATGFERGAELAAFEGVLELPLPAGRQGGSSARTALGALAVTLAALALARARRHRRNRIANA